MKKITYLLVLGCFVLNVRGLSKNSNDANSINSLVAGNNDFSFDLYGILKDESTGNLFFSPYSICASLAMTYGGAGENTKKQMAVALHFTLPDEQIFPVFGSLQKQLVKKDKSLGYQLLFANALWKQKGEPFLKEYMDMTQSYYEAGIDQLDFVNEAEKSRRTINDWVEEKTNNKINDLIPQGGVNSDTMLVLTNAVYFKGQWKTKFSWWKTHNADFSISAKEKVEIPLMHQKENYKHYKDNKLQALEMPYKGDEVSMLIILPDELDGLKEIENVLTDEKLNTILSKMWARKVDVYLPRFKITWGNLSLNKELVALGMPDAFDPGKANFSGMIGDDRKIWISNVIHKAFIEVNEEGTEAAASSGFVLVQSKQFEPPVFRADHPFLFMIRDNRSGSILFMGRVMNPAVEE